MMKILENWGAGRTRGTTAGVDGALRRAAFRLRQRGDQYRDQRRWQEAKGCYEQYLEIAPEDAAIWVQYGHACKELGDRAAAVAAYQKGTEVAPEDADAHFWLGQMVEVTIRGAPTAHRKANEDAPPHSASKDMPQRVLIDLTDVLVYLHLNHTVSGIQRVQLGLAEALLNSPPPFRDKLAFVCALEDGWRVIDTMHLANMIKRMSSSRVDQQRLEQAVYQIEADAFFYEPATGDLLLILGAFWAAEYLADQIIAVQRAGVRIAMLIHDLLQVTHPEFVERSATDRFQWFLDDLLPIADFLLAVSDYTADAVHQYLKTRGIPLRPITTLRLAHQTGLKIAEDGLPLSLSPTVTRLLQRPYVLYVSTIEIRKNHIFLFHIWKQLQRDLGEDLPTLIFAGKVGWRVGDLMEQLDNSDFLNGKIEVVEGLSDPELAELYRNCLFTVFPSFIEGWGLPVGESLVFGRPCLASQTSSLPEVGGEFVDYLNPFSIVDGCEKIRKFIVDAELREARAAAIRANFRPRLWSEVASDLIRIVEEHAAKLGTLTQISGPPILRPGIVYLFGPGGNPSAFVRSGRALLIRSLCDQNWFEFEEWGRWMRGRSALLHFRLANDRPREIMLVIELKVVEGFTGRMRITIDDHAYSDLRLRSGAIERVIIEVVRRSATLRIGFESTSEIRLDDDPRLLSLGIRSLGYAYLGYAGIEDLAARLRLLEAVSAQIYDLRPVEAISLSATSADD